MKKVALLILLLSIPYGLLHAQESTPTGGVTLKGRITDETASPVEIANIWVARQMKGTTTNLKQTQSRRFLRITVLLKGMPFSLNLI